jgi:hypothetical protein
MNSHASSQHAGDTVAALLSNFNILLHLKTAQTGSTAARHTYLSLHGAELNKKHDYKWHPRMVRMERLN